jgi:hypothetical protein
MNDSVGVAAEGSMGSDMRLILTHELFQYERKNDRFEASLDDLSIDR